ncbi:MAG: outer membrane lipoprotein-sorting protein [Candidatus Lernaella stagnicola]|nr:outer membrane lipoprotein-sorting protein [Candidatus Lernaella stagnicola]
MKFRWYLTAVAFALAWMVGWAFAADLTPFEIAKRSLELDKTPTKVTQYKMTVTTKKGRKRVYKFTTWDKQYADGSKKLIRFTEPADNNGTGLMTWEKKGADDLQWLYLPSQKKARQLAQADKSDQFMGSDLFFEDMGTQSAEDFNHTLISETVYNGKQCYLVESSPKPDVNSAYTKTRSLIDVDNFAPYKLELFGKGGKLIKTIESKKIEQIDGIWTQLYIVVTSQGGGRAKTEINIEQREYNGEVQDRFFTKKFLETY